MNGDVDGPTLIVLALFAAAIAGATARLPSIWKSGGRNAASGFKSWWPYSSAALGGWLRAMPTGILGGWCFVVTLVGLLVAVYFDEWRAPAETVATLGLLGMFGCLVLVASVILFNRPRLLVPPSRRSDAGLVHHWTRRRDRGRQDR